MDLSSTITKAYELMDARDFTALQGLFVSDAMLYIPGAARISGDHAVSELPRVFGDYMSGVSHQDRFNITAVGDHGYAFLADTVPIEGESEPVHYHVLHHWWAKEDKLGAFWFFPHEYDLFARAWA